MGGGGGEPPKDLCSRGGPKTRRHVAQRRRQAPTRRARSQTRPAHDEEGGHCNLCDLRGLRLSSAYPGNGGAVG